MVAKYYLPVLPVLSTFISVRDKNLVPFGSIFIVSLPTFTLLGV
nr:MAG TPA: hypothetical protein [Caudoviricetes sp.]